MFTILSLSERVTINEDNVVKLTSQKLAPSLYKHYPSNLSEFILILLPHICIKLSRNIIAQLNKHFTEHYLVGQ